ncbi:MAG: CDP-alcohol phosphatidyltransferase family protein [Phycisphaerales bacterium]|nr:CDP-alcohol phosphatidyltransferase family protein [Phycisphaerales bacterium]
MSVVPTLCTLGNLVAGFAAIHFAAKDPTLFRGPWGWTGLTLAGLLIFVGMFFDGVDGTVARLTRSTSKLGAQLDSLCDMVTFGVAPAFMALRLIIVHIERLEGQVWMIGPEADSVFGKILWGIAAAYVCCAALRLARFNVESDLSGVNDHTLFRGLPTPGAAGAVASLVILHQHLLVTTFPPPDVPLGFVQGTALIVPFVMLLCAIGMVSSIPYVHVTNRYLRGPQSFAYIARIVIVLALAVWWLQVTLAVVFATYAASGPVRLLWRSVRQKRPPTLPSPPAPPAMAA